MESKELISKMADLIRLAYGLDDVFFGLTIIKLDADNHTERLIYDGNISAVHLANSIKRHLELMDEQ